MSVAAAPQHEAAALASLAGRGLAGAVRRIEEVHQAIAERSFRSPGAQPSRAVHDTVSGAVYGIVRGGGRLAGAALAAGVEGRDFSGSPRGALVQSALNGLHGDLLEAEDSPLAVSMAVRVKGRDVETTPAALRAAFPDATGRIVVFVHGLGETEAAWTLRAERRGGATYATRLADEHGVTPVALRFNTGLHISDNGRRLADLLEALVAGWPVAVDRLDLIGHSLGGLVGRSACHVGAGRGDAWIDVVATTIGLGTPHHGAPLEQAVNLLGWLLRRAPESTPLATVLEARSAGIKDLRFGAICEADWVDVDPDALLDDRRVDVPLHDGARHYAVAATLTADDRHPLARVLGDALVLAPSAHGIGRGDRRTGFADEDVHHVGGIAHLGLLNDARVEEQLVRWLR
jgi:hypothetical protein